MFELQNVDKFFPGVHALKSISMQVDKGEIIGLVGENGAGKSTLMKIIYGAYQPDGGTVSIQGEPVDLKSPRHAMELGVGMVFQEQSLIPELSVMENIFLGSENQFSRWGVINWDAMSKAAAAQLEKVHLDIDPGIPADKLSFSQRRLVELAKVLTLEERVDRDLVILLDEPTSVLAQSEVKLLFKLVKELTSRASFIFVSHRLDEILELSDRIYVMKDGEVVLETKSEETDSSTVQSAMVGRPVEQGYYHEELQNTKLGDAVVSLDSLSVGSGAQDISLDLHAGEILSLVGTEGCGNEEIMRSIFGLEQATAGHISIEDSQISSGYSPDQAVSMGVGYLPRERKIEGIVEPMSIEENITLSHLKQYSHLGFISSHQEQKSAKEWMQKLSIKAPDKDVVTKKLSGGNQQKVVLARWRDAGVKVLMMDHPTRGLDIGAKEDVYALMRTMVSEGVAILLIADTLEEAIGMSNTIVVLKDRKITKKIEVTVGSKPTPLDILEHMI